MNILFLDIETVSCKQSYSELSQRMQQAWAKKANSLKLIDCDLETAFWERAGIYAEFGKIVCIGMGFISIGNTNDNVLRVKGICGHDEKEVLQNFKNVIENSNISALCAHNGKEFDFPYLCRRMVINNIPLPPMLDIASKKPWEINHLDTMELWRFGDRKSYTSLELLASIFDIPSSKVTIDGSQVNEYYHRLSDLDSIKNYCIGDVIVTAQVFLRLKLMPIIRQENIIFS
jgi:predicted PolB exonuclease-like 3'-5' exonuclease